MHNATFLLKSLLRKHLQLASTVQLSTQNAYFETKALFAQHGIVCWQ